MSLCGKIVKSSANLKYNTLSRGYAITTSQFRNLQTSLLDRRDDLHVSTPKNYPLAAALQLPYNVEEINSCELGRFSPLRQRDICGPVILSHGCERELNNFPKIDVTSNADPHVGSYDCQGAVNLSSSMQSNVPSPFSGNATHLGMPGSQWGQGYKYLSEHLNNSHYLTLRNEVRKSQREIRNSVMVMGITNTRSYSSSADPKDKSKTVSQAVDNVPRTTREKMKKAVTEYGSTVIIFHVSISLASLGTCYLLVSRWFLWNLIIAGEGSMYSGLVNANSIKPVLWGSIEIMLVIGLDMTPILEYFNIGQGLLSKTAASSTGTFVVAYAIHKVFAPVRMAITLTATPFIVRYLRNIGILKKPLEN